METSPSSETPQAPDRSMRLLLIVGVPMVLLIVAAVGGYTWFALYGPCTVNSVETASNTLLGQLTQFDLVYQSIPSRTPVMIIGPMTQMQQILMDTKETAIPACMQTARNELITAMETLIRALLAIMESQPETTIQDLTEKSTSHLDNFTSELEIVNKCAPFCPGME